MRVICVLLIALVALALCVPTAEAWRRRGRTGRARRRRRAAAAAAAAARARAARAAANRAAVARQVAARRAAAARRSREIRADRPRPAVPRAEPRDTRGFQGRWDKTSGSHVATWSNRRTGAWTTGWNPRSTRTCFNSFNCQCGGENHCGVAQPGQTVSFWPAGCNGAKWRMKCSARRKPGTTPRPRPRPRPVEPRPAVLPRPRPRPAVQPRSLRRKPRTARCNGKWKLIRHSTGISKGEYARPSRALRNIIKNKSNNLWMSSQKPPVRGATPAGLKLFIYDKSPTFMQADYATKKRWDGRTTSRNYMWASEEPKTMACATGKNRRWVNNLPLKISCDDEKGAPGVHDCSKAGGWILINQGRTYDWDVKRDRPNFTSKKQHPCFVTHEEVLNYVSVCIPRSRRSRPEVRPNVAARRRAAAARRRAAAARRRAAAARRRAAAAASRARRARARAARLAKAQHVRRARIARARARRLARIAAHRRRQAAAARLRARRLRKRARKPTRRPRHTVNIVRRRRRGCPGSFHTVVNVNVHGNGGHSIRHLTAWGRKIGKSVTVRHRRIRRRRLRRRRRRRPVRTISRRIRRVIRRRRRPVRTIRRRIRRVIRRRRRPVRTIRRRIRRTLRRRRARRRARRVRRVRRRQARRVRRVRRRPTRRSQERAMDAGR